MSMNEYKDQLVEKMEEVKSSVTNLIGQENIETMKETVEGVRESVSHVFSTETMEGVRDTMAEEAAMVAGYKDQLIGGMKETVGHYVGATDMEKEGHKQKLRGEAELAQHRAMGSSSRESELNARYQIGRQEVISDIDRSGGFDRFKSRLRHVETHERTLSDFIETKKFHLKKWDIKPLLADIRSKHPLKQVETKELGLMRSIPIDKKDFHLKESPRKRLFQDLNKEGALMTLHEVPREEIHDRSAPRLDLVVNVPQSHIGALLKEITKGTDLKHVETDDKSLPSLDTNAPIQLQKHDKNKLLKEIKGGAELKHVETEDKSKPSLDKNTHLKTWDRKGFLDEVRQGTELKHI